MNADFASVEAGAKMKKIKATKFEAHDLPANLLKLLKKTDDFNRSLMAISITPHVGRYFIYEFFVFMQDILKQQYSCERVQGMQHL